VDLPASPSFRLDGKRALVTGAGRGIGLAAASALADAGAHVTLAARTRSEIEAAAAAIRGRGQKAETLVLDVTDLPAMQAAIAEAEPLNVLVNNAGTNRPKMLLDMRSRTGAIMGLNVRAAYFVAQPSAPADCGQAAGLHHQHLLANGACGRGAPVGLLASKHAAGGFTRQWQSTRPALIRVNTVGPTFLETPLTKPFFDNAAFKAEVLAKIKLGRLGKVEDVTGAILFLASDAAGLVTGTSLVVDGGWTAD
jgi:NAD(P)-dependent dehydrogenase (short-subunit alcohol dehydrogenase family)